MPMYEKGSVRAEPRSKQQERMKKIMKKFLSSLLALTMILSLVIVPANATDTVVGISAQNASLQVNKGSTVTATVSKSKTITVNGKTATIVANSESWESADTTKATVTNAGVISGVSAGSTTVTYSVMLSYDPESEQTPSGARTATQVEYEVVFNVTVNDKILASDLTSVKFHNRPCTISGGKIVATRYEGENFGDNAWAVTAEGYESVSATYSAGNLTLTSGSVTGSIPVQETTVSLSVAPSSSLAIPTVSGHYEVIKGGDLVLRATSDGISNAKYAWYQSSTKVGEGATYSPDTSAATDVITLTCKVYEGTPDYENNTNLVKTTERSYKVVDEQYTLRLNGGFDVTLTEKNEQKTVKAVFAPKGSLTAVDDSIYSYNFELGKSGIVSLSSDSNKTGETMLTLLKDGTTTLTVKVMYKGKPYSASIDVKGEILSGELSEVTNGGKLTFDYDDLESVANKALPTGVSVKNNSNITVSNLPSSLGAGGFVYDGSSKKTSYVFDTNDSLEFRAAEGYIGTATMDMTVTGKDNSSYKIVVNIPVTSAKEINETVTGSTANSNVSFKVKDVVDYDYLYVYGTSKGSGTSATFNPGSLSNSSTTGYDAYWSGRDAKSGWVRFDDTDTITIPASEFSKSTGKVTLYVVGIDDDSVAYTGTITVSQKSYDINYNVVAGKSVSFNQKDFESFLEDYAEDNGNYNPKKDEITFDHAVLTSSIPSAKSEGTLYYGSTEITSSNRSKTEMTDMDKVSFDSVSKPTKDTVTLTFRVYGEIEKPNSRKPDKVNYDVNVVINVVKEDITYTVGIDDTVQLTARDFVNFLQDAKTSYRKSTLDYVKFDVSGKNVSSYAYGGLYRSYSSYSTGKLADSTDKFYYEPSRTQYDLADVAYHTTRWAEAGKTVYIPFTVYGTKNEEASGTMAITIAQTMNFIDVKASDFFYEPVKWAVNNKITNGTSSTTFSPYKNCNRAEIVTFLWRAAGSPEPTVTRNPFTDVNSVRDASYYKAILWASQKGITAGTNATTFSPYQECTRSQIVTFLYRYAGKPSGYYSNPFKDVSSVNEASYYNAILWAVGKGITQGTSTTTFSPYASCTRGEAVTFLYRYVNGVK